MPLHSQSLTQRELWYEAKAVAIAEALQEETTKIYILKLTKENKILLFYGVTGIYWETAAFDGGFYIPLKKYLSSIFKKYGTNTVAIRNIVKMFRIKIYCR